MSHFLRFIPLISLIFLSGCGASADDVNAQKGQPAPTVLVKKVSFAAGQNTKTYAATIQPRTINPQAFRVSGKVVRRLVDVGTLVRAGTPLAALDAADFNLQLKQAQAEVEAAQNSLKQQQLENDRQHQLNKQGWVAPAAVDRQQAATDEAQSRLTKALQALQLAQNAVAYTTLVADTAGVVTATAAEPGQILAAGQTAITIAKNGELEVLVAVPENEVNLLNQGSSLLSLWNDPAKTYELTLRELSPLADPATRTFSARYTISNADINLHLGMSGQVTISRPGEKTAAVPLSALVDQGNGPGVWSVDRESGKLQLKPVVIAALEQNTARIFSGVRDNEWIVALGAQKLDPGLTVHPVETLQR